VYAWVMNFHAMVYPLIWPEVSVWYFSPMVFCV
jgi:hypothetical protein